MRTPIAIGLVVLAAGGAVRAQDHTHAKQTLFTVRAVPEQVVRRGALTTKGSATGAFVISTDAKSVSYRVTWNALRGTPTRVDLHNFASGRDGAVVHEICGRSSRPCPAGNAGTIEGTWTFPKGLARELAVERIYLDIHTASGPNGEIRGQIRTVPWMAHSRQFTVALGTGARTGTATIFITQLDQFEQMEIDVTVAGVDAETLQLEVGGPTPTRIPLVAQRVKRRAGTVTAQMRSTESAAVAKQVLTAISRGDAELRVITPTTPVTGRIRPVL